MCPTSALPLSSDPEAMEEERAKLAEVLRAMLADIQGIKDGSPAKAAYQQAADLAQKSLDEIRKDLEDALAQPYFGRLDYLPIDAPRRARGQNGDDDESKRIYIGSTWVNGQDVYSWAAPVARLWYTDDSEVRGGRGVFRVRLDLKRYLQIRDGQLIDLNDLYRRALPAAATQTAKQSPLAQAVGSVGDTQLDVIIETIDPLQYEAIANKEERVMVVQGSAGSGKSEIGLHRIAYLLSPYSELGQVERPTPATTLFIGPSQPFLDYAADILPGLGIRQRVAQTTLHEWMEGQRSVSVRFQPQMWRHLLSQGELTLYNAEAETFKGSLDMAAMLERYATERSKQIGAQCQQALEGETGQELERLRTLSKAEVQGALDIAFAAHAHSSPLNQRRTEFISRAASIARGKINSRYLEEQRKAIGQATAWCRRLWPQLNVREEYLALLSDPDELVRLSRKRVSEETADDLAAGADRASRIGLLDSDEGALTYMDHLLNGTIQQAYRHIVVDEAQDVSPIEFKLLNAASFNSSFTVMGDLAQRLRPYKGIRRWGEVGRVLNQKEVKVQHARMSYRSNNHITRFNNRVLRLYEKSLDAPIPFAREGHRPEYHRHALREDMYAKVVSELDRIRSFDEMQEASIAILVRDRENLNNFQKFCNDNGVNGIVAMGAKAPPGDGAVLARIPDARGLEYDAVIVMGVNDTFANTNFNQRLLYIAITRAKHYLALHWYGDQSPILRSVYSGGVRQFDHRRKR